jgi:hypothetical protein
LYQVELEGAMMAIKEIRISDISGKEIIDGDHVTLTVSDHPALGGRTVELDAEASELES